MLILLSSSPIALQIQRVFVPLNDRLLIDTMEEEAEKLMPDLLVMASEGLSDPVVPASSLAGAGGASSSSGWGILK